MSASKNKNIPKTLTYKKAGVNIEAGNKLVKEIRTIVKQTKKLENRAIEKLINKTYQDLLIKLSENI